MNLKEKKHREWIVGLWASFMLICLLILILHFIAMPLYTKHWQQVELPDVVEYACEEARAVLRESGFKMVLDGEEFHPTLPESTIIFQKPPALTKVKKGRRIYVVISAGEQLMTVPRLIGSSEREAVLSLKQAQLEVGEIRYRISRFYPQNVVSMQDTTPHLQVRKGTAVGFTVSMGAAQDQYTVPDLINKSYAEARQLIQKSGLTVGEITHAYQPDLLPETVLFQSFAPDAEVHAGQSVDLVLSNLTPDSASSDSAVHIDGDAL